DFVEGIKPQTVENEQGESSITYEVKDGIFKIMCNNAEDYLSAKMKVMASDQKRFDNEDFKQGIFWKMSLGDANSQEDQPIYDYCIKEGYIALGKGGDVDYTDCQNESEIKSRIKSNGARTEDAKYVNAFRLYMKTGNYVVVTNGNYSFRAIGKITGQYEYKPQNEIEYNHFRKVDWLITDVDFNYAELQQKQFSQSTLYRLNKDQIRYQFFDRFKVKDERSSEHLKKENFVLIIDEINRGNVSQIFGELITLLESDKRKGNNESLQLTLSYSQKLFSVPDNLYLIGTMNTADRSVETLDSALRRRFHFREMNADPALLSPAKVLVDTWNEDRDLKAETTEFSSAYKKLTEFIGLEINAESEKRVKEILGNDDSELDYDQVFEEVGITFTGINLMMMLQTINARIKLLLDSDHMIGHAYFMNVYSSTDPFEALTNTFQSNIIPLLQEYFFNDYGKIGLIVGEAFVEAQESENIRFATFPVIDDDIQSDYAQKPVYMLTNPATWTVESFLSIYV
ncbi:MAG: AAA family ATPase, partial [Cyclobacteriaceae bacterium]